MATTERGHTAPRSDPFPSITLVVNEKQCSPHSKGIPSSSPHTSQLQQTANDMIISASFPGPPKTMRKGLEMNSKICLKFPFCFLTIRSTQAICFAHFFLNSMPICFLVYSCFLTKRAELSSLHRDCVAYRALSYHHLPLTEKACHLIFIVTLGYTLTM